MARRVLLLAATTGYQTRAFGDAASRLGVSLVLATDRCDQLEDPWADHAIPIRFHLEDAAVDTVAEHARDHPIDGVLAVGDRPTVIASRIAERLGLPWHPSAAVRAARSKRLARERLGAAGLPSPRHVIVCRTADPVRITLPFGFPVVVKPTVLSGSRGVIRADDHRELAEAIARVQRLLSAPDVRALHDPAAEEMLVEQYVAGREYAVEGLVERGRLRTLAIFDKPDPLEGPFFEETIYVTPSRADAPVLRAIETAVADAIRVLELSHGPVHAECRAAPSGVTVLEVAPRPIGGLCAQALRFSHEGAEAPFEELLLRHAIGEPVGWWQRESAASGVMMVPIPAEGIYRHVTGVDAARAVAGVWDVAITAKPDQRLVKLPEAAGYLGFIFARDTGPERVEGALREAHRRLTFVIDRPVPISSAL